MTIEQRPRAQGYIKGMGRRDELNLAPRPDEHIVLRARGRVGVPMVAIDLDRVKQLGHPVYPSDVVPQGHPVLVNHGILAYHYGVYMHPTDYYWYKYEPDKAHRNVMSWIEQRIEKMGQEAEARLDEMVIELSKPRIFDHEYDALRIEAFIKYGSAWLNFDQTLIPVEGRP